MLVAYQYSPHKAENNSKSGNDGEAKPTEMEAEI